MITRPAWAKGAIPTERGWVRGKEILKLRKHTPEEVAEWMAANGETPAKPVKPKKVEKLSAPKRRTKKIVEEVIVTETKAVSLTEAPVSNVSLGDMTAPQLEAIKKQYNVEVDQENSQTLTED